MLSGEPSDLSITPSRDEASIRASREMRIALFVIGFGCYLNLNAVQPLLPLFRRVFDASEIQVSLTVSASALAVALTAPLAGVVADRLGRKRIIAASMFGVALATLKRYLKQRRETGSILPKPIPGRPPKKCAPLEAGIVSQLKAHADVTLEEHCRLWEASTGMRVSTSSMSRVIRRLGWTRKKNRQGKRGVVLV